MRRHGASGLPAWFAIEASAMHLRDAVTALRERRLAAASAAAAAAFKRLASGNTVAALALPRTWRMVRQRLRNAA